MSFFPRTCIPMVGEQILVVDDEDSIREIVCSMLNAAGYQCKQASSGVDALGVLATGEDFALMLSDLMMRDLDGMAFWNKPRSSFLRCRSSWSLPSTTS